MGGSSSTGTKPQKLTTISVQTSSYGICMGLAWGTARVTGNLIWYGDFVATEHTEKQGGKGGGVSSTSYSYEAAFALGLAECEVVDIPRVWAAKDKTTLSALGFDLLNGYAGQAPWSYLTSKHPTEALNYPDLAYVAAGDFNLGSTASLPNLAFELVTSSAGVCGTPDAAPWAIVTDLLALGGFPVARIGSMTTYTDYCGAHGLFLSPALTEQKRAAEHVQDILDMTHTAAVASEGVLKLVPYGDTAATANGYTFTPTVAPIYDLTDDDFLGLDGNLPIRIKRKAQSDAKNRLLIEFKDRSREYATNTAPAFDEAHIAEFGERPAETVQYDAIKDPNVAAQVAFLKLQRGLYVLNTYEFRLGWRYCLLEPMDILTLTHSLLGLNRLPVRIVSVEEDIDGALTITAEDFPMGAGLAPKVAPQPPNGYSEDMNAPPGDTHPPVIFQGPISYSYPYLQCWMAASGGPLWGGCHVWVSDDGDTYRQIGTIPGPARHGTLTALLPVGADPDTTHSLSVELSASRGQLLSGTTAAADLADTVMWVNGELISYATATLTGSHAYDLTYLRRGIGGTRRSAHAAGAPFVRLDDAVFKFNFDLNRIGHQIWIKLPAFNARGESVQNLADVTAYSYTLDHFSLAMPTPVQPTVYCTPDSAGHVSRAKVKVSFDSTINQPVTALCFFVSSFPFDNAAHIDSGGTGSTLTLSGIDLLSNGSFTVLSGSTPGRIVVTTPDAPLWTSWNPAGRWWAQLPGGEWAKATGVDATAFLFDPPHNTTPVPGSTMIWSEISWADARTGEYKLAILYDGTTYEILRWTSLDANGPGGAIRMLGCTRGVEGTSVLNADGKKLHYLPAPGPGTSMTAVPISQFKADGLTYTAEVDVDFQVPAGDHLSLSAVMVYELPTGTYVQSQIVPAIYGGPL